MWVFESLDALKSQFMYNFKSYYLHILQSVCFWLVPSFVLQTLCFQVFQVQLEAAHSSVGWQDTKKVIFGLQGATPGPLWHSGKALVPLCKLTLHLSTSAVQEAPRGERARRLSHPPDCRHLSHKLPSAKDCPRVPYALPVIFYHQAAIAASVQPTKYSQIPSYKFIPRFWRNKYSHQSSQCPSHYMSGPSMG